MPRAITSQESWCANCLHMRRALESVLVETTHPANASRIRDIVIAALSRTPASAIPEDSSLSGFRRCPDESIGGTYLVERLPFLTMERARALFGEPDKGSLCEPGRGYDGAEYAFVDGDGHVANLYFRWGAARVGARSGEVGMRFASWVRTQDKIRQPNCTLCANSPHKVQP